MAARKTSRAPVSEDYQKIVDLVKPLGAKYVKALPSFEARTEFYQWVLEQLKGCQECLLAANRSSVVLPDGELGAEIMVVAEGPGFLEDRAGIPMVGPLELVSSRCSECSKCSKCFGHRVLKSADSWKKKPSTIPKCLPTPSNSYQLPETFYVRSAGSILDGLLLKKWKAAYPRQSWINAFNKQSPTPWEGNSPWFLTNVVMCRASDFRTDKDITPPTTAKNACRQWLIYQYAAVQPKIIIALGKVALAAILGSEKAASRVRNNTIITTRFGPVLYQVHPANAMREVNSFSKGYAYAKIGEALELALQFCGLQV